MLYNFLLIFLCVNWCKSLYIFNSKIVLQKHKNLLCMILPNTNRNFHKKSKYLNAVQWKHINMILTNNNSTTRLREKTKNIIYNYYEDWALSKVYHIKNKYSYLCRHIQIEELKLYAYIGLKKAIINYDKEKDIIYNFSDYAYNYVYDEIIYGISELLPIYLKIERQRHYTNKTNSFYYKKKQK